MKQLLIRAHLPAGIILHAPDFREMLPKVINSRADEFFHYRNGIPRPGHPHIRVVGGLRWVGVVADPGYEDILLANAAAIIEAVAKHVGAPVPVAVEHHEVGGVIVDDVPRVFRVPRLALRVRTARSRGPDKDQLYSERILLGLAELDRVYGSLNLPAPPERISADMAVRAAYVASLRDALGFQLFDTYRPMGMQVVVPSGPTNERVTLVGCTFGIQADLVGILQIGCLTSRGFGRIIVPRSRPPVRRAA